MSLEYQIWEMLAGVGNYHNVYDPVKDLSDKSFSEQFDNRGILMKAVQMREQGLLIMEDGKVKLKTCYENPDVVRINFPIGSKQSYHSNSSLVCDVVVSGYGYIQHRNMSHITTFVVLVRDPNDVLNDYPVHPNKFIQ